MFKLLEKFLILIVIIQLLILSNVLAVTGNQPVIASRISEISEIAIIDLNYQSSSTLFGIKTKVEILNRAEENQTVSVGVDCYPKVLISAVFVDQLLELEQWIWCLDMSKIYSYPPGITVEYEVVQFYINQKGLSQLPDGNYTLCRPISGEQFPTIIIVNSGIIKIIYHSFYYNRTEEVSSDTQTPDQTTDDTNFLLTSPLVFIFLLSFLINVYKRRKTITN
ncbi:MAG: hypothetical protein HGN29_13035 [Asgard group archaeon]|nr:hypothetical protein [Asgard group archaeon]